MTQTATQPRYEAFARKTTMFLLGKGPGVGGYSHGIDYDDAMQYCPRHPRWTADDRP